MSLMYQAHHSSHCPDPQSREHKKIRLALHESWKIISPFWPLKNLIAVNPLRGFEDLTFKEALQQGHTYFQQEHLPTPMQDVNRETIKWLQAFFDDGQATITMPFRHLGLLPAIKRLLAFDNHLISKHHTPNVFQWFQSLPDEAELLIQECLAYLHIPQDMQTEYVTLMLTTLPGWASYVQYKTRWQHPTHHDKSYPLTSADYTALRLLFTCLLFPEGIQLLAWHKQQHATKKSTHKNMLTQIKHSENRYRENILQKLRSSQQNLMLSNPTSEAQFVFCIDVRSEPFRRALEAQGNYETYGFAGFFGIPLTVHDEIKNEHYASCPVLLQPEHTVIINNNNNTPLEATHRRHVLQQNLYQSLKDGIVTSLAVAETLGIASSIFMFMRTFFPNFLKQLKSLHKNAPVTLPTIDSITAIPLQEQSTYASQALRLIGLVDHFAPLIILCGHGSKTQNNAYASILDCGACGGRPGGLNAFVLATMLNNQEVRSRLKKDGISIPETTYFLAAQHTTTTDDVELFDHNVPQEFIAKLAPLKHALLKAKTVNSRVRLLKLGEPSNKTGCPDIRANNWSYIKSEWGLARNASFIIGPRSMSKDVDLEGRAFLHSYDWTIDKDGSLLTKIFSGPLIVAQWINCQYLFSTLDNVAFGGGSKITQNITGNIGLMQGNASDLMHGLALQSVFKTDNEVYHEPARLLVIVYAPKTLVYEALDKQQHIKKLLMHEWIHLTCIDPQDNTLHDFTTLSFAH